MKIVCSQSDLKNNLALVSRVVPSRPEPPILGNILLVADETTQKLTMTGYDTSLGIRSSLNANVIEEGKVTLPAKLLNDIVSKLPEVEITISCGDEMDNFVVTLSSASGKFQLNGTESEEYPELPVVENEDTIDIPISVLKEGIKGCLFCASTELSKQILTGVNFVSKEEEGCWEFASTDSHRLSVMRMFINEEDNTIEKSLPTIAVTIPARALKELEKMLGDIDGETIKMRYNETQIIFEIADSQINSIRLTGAYPPYGRLIPTSFTRYVICDRKSLLSSLELVAVLAQKDDKKIVKMSLDNDREELILSVEARDVGSAKQSIAANIVGDSIDLAFNIKYLMDGIKALPSNEIKIHLNEWNQPVIFTPISGTQMTYLLMPIQIRN